MKNAITHVVKRSGKRVLFNENKIVSAVWRSMQASAEGTLEDAEEVMELVVELLNRDFKEKTPSVEDVQDRVEQALMQLGHSKVAKGYILYRSERAKLREQKSALIGGRIDDLPLSLNALRILEKRYLLRDENGQLETPKELFWRVARTVAMAQVKHDRDVKQVARQYYKAMSDLAFLPSSPVLMNAGTGRQLSSSFVVPVEDAMEGIFEALKSAAIIHQSGGGTGFSFSRLRPRGDTVDGTTGVAGGPVSFMRIFDTAIGAIKQSGRRSGANMAVLRVDHPDILDFINLKLDRTTMTNFNLSVAITDAFMQALEEGNEYDLINPRTNEPVGKLSARVVFDTLLSVSWRCGDPGVVFIDRINASNPCPHLGTIEGTNPCGEQPMLPWGSCNEGSVNLAACLTEPKKEGESWKFDWPYLRELARLGVSFLDDCIDVNPYPLSAVEKHAKRVRRIGLGVMGFADVLYRLEIPYGSEEAEQFATRVGEEIAKAAIETSEELAQERGSFPAWRGSALDKAGMRRRRNSALLGIAPTGTISLLADVSAGIEPNWALAYTRTTADGADLLVTNPAFEEAAKLANLSEETVRQITKRGRIEDEDDVPAELRRVFVTAQQIAPEWHIRIQAAFQKSVDAAISKTINYPAKATVTDIEEGFRLAWRLGCKGITVYRDSSLDTQVLSAGGGS